LRGSEALRLCQRHPYRFSANATGDRHGATVPDSRLQEVVAQRGPDHRSAGRSRKGCPPVREDAIQEQLSVRQRPDGEQGAADPRGLSVAAFHAAGEMQLEAAPAEGAEPERLDHANGLDPASGHGL